MMRSTSAPIDLQAPQPQATFLDNISALMLTYNEEENIGRTLAALERFTDIVVLDSGSTDATVSIVASFTNARLVTRTFDEHATQWNFGLQKCGIENQWVLALDADYILTSELVQEIADLDPLTAISGYEASFRYCVYGKRLSASLYPPHLVLFRRECAHYVQHGHTQRVVVKGQTGQLKAHIDHDDRKPLSRWLASQQKYAKLEAGHLLTTPRVSLRRSDRVRLMGWPAPFFVFLYTLIVQRCLLDGWRGWLYVLQRTLAEMMIALEVVDRRLRPGRGSEVANADLARRARGR